MIDRIGLTKGELWATVVVVLLALAGVLALWPQDRSGESTGAAPATAADHPAWPGDAALAAARQAAALPPCPHAEAPAPSGPLAGIRVPCLGAPGVVEPAAGLAGRDALLNVWASWCEPCRAELPALAEYAARPGAVPVLGIDSRDRPDAALALLADLDARIPTVADPRGELASALRLPPALPASYLLRADGTVTRIEPAIPFRTADEVSAAVARSRSVGS